MTYPNGPKILALDLATNVGWACLSNGIITHGEESMKRIHGLKRQPDEHLGAAFFKFRNFLTDSIHLHKPEQLVTEYTGFFKSAPARDICCGFRGILLEVAARNDLPVFSYAPGTIKKFWHGSGNADKDAMIDQAEMRGWGRLGPDECDAIAMLHLHIDKTSTPDAHAAP
jgi:Holliday junction resolvasome RuvABC endonuclease subunit